jgi:hypothetical protein
VLDLDKELIVNFFKRSRLLITLAGTPMVASWKNRLHSERLSFVCFLNQLQAVCSVKIIQGLGGVAPALPRQVRQFGFDSTKFRLSVSNSVMSNCSRNFLATCGLPANV